MRHSKRPLAYGSYKTAPVICADLRRTMLALGRRPVAGLVEVEETQDGSPQRKRSGHGRWQAI
jgi:hypothetical protein